MSRAPTFGHCNTSAAPLVDRYLGDAYNEVKEVADRLQDIIDALYASGAKYETIEYLATEGQTEFEVSRPILSGFIHVFINGVLLSNSDFYYNDGSITLSEAVKESDIVSIAGHVRDLTGFNGVEPIPQRQLPPAGFDETSDRVLLNAMRELFIDLGLAK